MRRSDESRDPGRWTTLSACLGLACLSCVQAPLPPQGTPFADGGVHVEVRNRSPDDATLYAFHGGRRERVGDVPGGNTVHFTLDWSRAATTYFEFDPIRKKNCRTRAIAVRPGESLIVWMEYRAAVQNDGVLRGCDLWRDPQRGPRS